MSKDPTYGEAMSEIEEILEKIETGELDVDALTEKVKRVASLLDICRKKLKTTEAEIQKVIEGMGDTDSDNRP
jgi:exodeoxyribonuclease VII small subunit